MNSLYVFGAILFLCEYPILHDVSFYVYALPDNVGTCVTSDQMREHPFRSIAVIGIWIVNSVKHCGGVLVSKRKVATAAHCFPSGAKKFYVRFGSNNVLTPTGSYNVSAENIWIHPRYNEDRSLEYDVAVILFDEDIQLDKKINVTDVDYKSPVEDNQLITIVGFDKNYSLKQKDTNVMDMMSCKNLVSSKMRRELNSTQSFCLHPDDNGQPLIMEGDSGGPVFSKDEKNKNKWIGIISKEMLVTKLSGFKKFIKDPETYGWNLLDYRKDLLEDRMLRKWGKE